MKTRLSPVAGLIAATAIFGGCAVTPAYETRYIETVRIAPPPPRVEYIGPPPVVGHVWITGYWNWGGSRYVWVPGRWEAPRPGHVWIPHRWEQHGDHWRRYDGHWEPHSHHLPPRSEMREMPRYEPRHDDRGVPRPTPEAPVASQGGHRWQQGESSRHDDRQPRRDEPRNERAIAAAERPPMHVPPPAGPGPAEIRRDLPPAAESGHERAGDDGKARRERQDRRDPFHARDDDRSH